ncbi:MAG: hypothetical protein UY75_C0039G0010, partial [Parcubacteria group bacterium GW2011_GWC2_52_8c]
VQAWARRNLPNYELYNRGFTPAEQTPGTQLEATAEILKPNITLVSPVNGQFVSGDLTIEAAVQAPLQGIKLEVIVNGTAVDHKSGPLGTAFAYKGTIPRSALELQNTVTVRITDAFGNVALKTVIVFQ